jgi:hypothetical protein
MALLHSNPEVRRVLISHYPYEAQASHASHASHASSSSSSSSSWRCSGCKGFLGDSPMGFHQCAKGRMTPIDITEDLLDPAQTQPACILCKRKVKLGQPHSHPCPSLNCFSFDLTSLRDLVQDDTKCGKDPLSPQ